MYDFTGNTPSTSIQDIRSFGELGTNMGPMLPTVVPDPSDPSMDKFSTMDANVWFNLINESSDI